MGEYGYNIDVEEEIMLIFGGLTKRLRGFEVRTDEQESEISKSISDGSQSSVEGEYFDIYNNCEDYGRYFNEAELLSDATMVAGESWQKLKEDAMSSGFYESTRYVSVLIKNQTILSLDIIFRIIEISR